jgi:hypothetical protein
MKKAIVAILAVASLSSVALGGNYILTVDGKRYEIDLDASVRVPLEDGRSVTVELARKKVATFKTGAFSFDHPSDFAPARTDLGDGVHQTMMTTPSGTVVMIQEYDGMNPAGLVDFMLTELLKEEVQYGYKITKSEARKKLADGRTVSGKRAVSIYKADEWDRYVLCHGVRDAGIMIITMIEKASPREDQAMLDLFWKTMSVLDEVTANKPDAGEGS